MGNAGYVLTGVNSLYFNGVNSAIDGGNSPLYDSLTLTLECWLTPYNLTGRILGKNNINQNCLINLESGKVAFKLNSLMRDDLFSPQDLIVGETYHIVGSVNLTHMYLFINGILVASKEMAYQPRILNDHNFYLGYEFRDGRWVGDPLHADVYLAALYNACWNEQTVANRYASLNQNYVNPNCIVLWNAQDIQNPIIDRSSNGNYGIMHNVDSSIRRIRHLRNYEKPTEEAGSFVRPKKTMFKDESGNWKRVNT